MMADVEVEGSGRRTLLIEEEEEEIIEELERMSSLPWEERQK